MDPMTASTILKRNSAQVMETAGVAPVTPITATMNEASETLAMMIERMRKLASGLRLAADQVYGEVAGQPDVGPTEAPMVGCAGVVRSQLTEMERWLAQCEGEAARLCGGP